MAIRLLAGSLTDYRRATDGWWYTISREVDRYLESDLFYRPVYFVSSNTHSLLNLLGGYVRRPSSRTWRPIWKRSTRRICGITTSA